MTPIAPDAMHASPARGERSAIDMIADCFRHQHPEAFGQTPVPGPVLPGELRGGRDEAPPPRLAEFIPEEPMGHPAAARLGRQPAASDWRWDV
jgi:hypothetical protein